MTIVALAFTARPRNPLSRSGARKTDYFLPLREVTVGDIAKHPNSN